MDKRIDRAGFRRLSRRELLKLTPLLALGAFALPATREALLSGGDSFNGWAQSLWYRAGHRAATFPDSEVVPLNKFPYNYYDVLDPEIDLDKWRLRVGGLVKRPGDYTLAQIQALPRVRQNTRHVCVEGWDVIGNFGGVRIAD